jgi:hypothetical protein
MNREQLLKEIGFSDDFITAIRDFESKIPDNIIIESNIGSDKEAILKIQQFEVDYTKPVTIYQPH